MINFGEYKEVKRIYVLLFKYLGIYIIICLILAISHLLSFPITKISRAHAGENIVFISLYLVIFLFLSCFPVRIWKGATGKNTCRKPETESYLSGEGKAEEIDSDKDAR